MAILAMAGLDRSLDFVMLEIPKMGLGRIKVQALRPMT